MDEVLECLATGEAASQLEASSAVALAMHDFYHFETGWPVADWIEGHSQSRGRHL